MSRLNLENSKLYSPELINNVKGSVIVQTLTGTTTLALPLARVYSLDPGGAGRNLVLPTEADSKGVEFYIVNTADAAETITVKASNGTTTVGTIDQNEGAVAVCDGTRWKVMVNAET